MRDLTGCWNTEDSGKLGTFGDVGGKLGSPSPGFPGAEQLSLPRVFPIL